MVFTGCALIAPRAPGLRLAGAALAFAFVIEFAQLYQAPWINAIRATTLGHLVLGTGFQWWDLLAYAVGVGFGWRCDAAIAKRPGAARMVER